jgi:hypothetical protein
MLQKCQRIKIRRFLRKECMTRLDLGIGSGVLGIGWGDDD